MATFTLTLTNDENELPLMTIPGIPEKHVHRIAELIRENLGLLYAARSAVNIGRHVGGLMAEIGALSEAAGPPVKRKRVGRR